ncbi:MAG: hypothetical protein QOE12_646 [Mycobacterium sp.]|nr:hypothetical protein [Mycobacterium sp.]MDT7733472.1 hypothetical protein [Mycobacterium sp.]
MVRRLAALLGVALALSPAGPAYADPRVDASFVDALTRAGITFNDSASAVNAGKNACALMDQGTSQRDVVALVMQQNSGISTVSAAQFTAIAASAYCPRHLQRVRDDSGDPALPPVGGVGGSGSSQQ